MSTAQPAQSKQEMNVAADRMDKSCLTRSSTSGLGVASLATQRGWNKAKWSAEAPRKCSFEVELASQGDSAEGTEIRD
jgi:hypothetical protein